MAAGLQIDYLSNHPDVLPILKGWFEAEWASYYGPGALPLTIAGELVGEVIWRNRLAHAIESNTKGLSLSWLRMLYALVAMLLVFGLVFVVGHFMEAQ